MPMPDAQTSDSPRNSVSHTITNRPSQYQSNWFAVYDRQMLDVLTNYCDNSEIEDWIGPDQLFPTTDAVAYSYGCKDTVEHFNDEIQSANAWLVNHPPTEWSTCTAQCYRPRLRMPWLQQWFTASYPNDHVYNPKRQSGIDCSGFVQRGAKYHTAIPKLSEAWLKYYDNFSGANCYSSVLNAIQAADFLLDKYTTAVDINRIVPGDVLVSSGHIAVVWKIDIALPRGEWKTIDPVFRQGVKVIEANSEIIYNKVAHERTYDTYSTFTFRRLKE